MIQEIEQFVADFNRSWISGQLDQLSSLLDDQVVFVTPDLTTEIRGKEKCLQTVQDYFDNAITKRFEIIDQKVRVWGKTAMVTLDYEVVYQINGKDFHERGRELWTLQYQNGAWKLIWRATVMNEEID